MKWWISLLIGVCSASCVRNCHETAAALSHSLVDGVTVSESRIDAVDATLKFSETLRPRRRQRELRDLADHGVVRDLHDHAHAAPFRHLRPEEAEVGRLERIGMGALRLALDRIGFSS